MAGGVDGVYIWDLPRKTWRSKWKLL